MTIDPISRRTSFKVLAGLGTGVLLSPALAFETVASVAPPSDEDIFNFALNLESLEAEYYLWGTMGHGLSANDAGPDAGRVRGGKMLNWKDHDLHEFMREVAANELAHVRFYRKTLGKKAVSRPELDIQGGFAAAAKAAGLGDNFDPFADEMSFLLGGMLMEDVGVTAYNGAVPLIKNKVLQQAASGVLAVEAYHMGMVRSSLYRMGPKARDAANALSDARDKLDGPSDVDQGIEVPTSLQPDATVAGRANIVPSDADGKAFVRTPEQVLNIVYLNPAKGVSSGGIFPRGMNGKIRTT